MTRNALLLSFLSLFAVQSVHAQTVIPKTVVLDGSRLVCTKAALDTGTASSALQGALANLIVQADKWLPQGPWAVTNKTAPPPGGVINDYASQAPYYWPSNTPDGCPYVNRDGQRNPEAAQKYPDHGNRLNMFLSSYTLSLAWWYTGNPEYGRKAGTILRTWFITPASRMNPNLDHAQLVPCANTGRYFGIIDWAQGYTSVLDAAAILGAGAPGWSASDAAAFKTWNAAYLNWLETSSFGTQETAATNNHGTFALLQSAGVALFTGDTALAARKVTAMRPRIEAYISADGSQPQELTRTRSFHYSVFNLIAYTRTADIGKKIGVNLWNFKGTSGQSIQQAVNFLLPAATGAKSWDYPEIDFQRSVAGDVIHSAADNGNAAAKNATSKVPPPSGGDLWLLRPSPEQLDATT